MFENSPVSKELIEYLTRKFGNKLSWITLLKILAAISCMLPRPRLCLLHITPSRQGKSFTLKEIMQIIDKEFWIDLGSDWTMNSLRRFVDCIDHKCLLVDDAVVLLNSKVLRAKDRLVGGLGEWISEEQYTYRDFGKTWTLSGIITMVINITSESFLHNKDTLFGSTSLSGSYLYITLSLSSKKKRGY